MNMNKLTVALSVLVLSFSVHADFVFDPAKWGVQMGAREGVKAEKTTDGALLITLPAAATNRVQLSYKFGNEPLRFTAYPCLEMVIAASGGLAGGELYMVPPGNGAGGGHIGISTAYKAKNPNWWSHQRDSLIGCFHPAKQQVIIMAIDAAMAHILVHLPFFFLSGEASSIYLSSMSDIDDRILSRFIL